MFYKVRASRGGYVDELDYVGGCPTRNRHPIDIVYEVKACRNRVYMYGAAFMGLVILSLVLHYNGQTAGWVIGGLLAAFMLIRCMREEEYERSLKYFYELVQSAWEQAHDEALAEDLDRYHEVTFRTIDLTDHRLHRRVLFAQKVDASI